MEKNRAVKAVKYTLTSLWWLVLALLAIILVNVFGAKLSGKVPSVFGYSVMNIVSGSMEEEIPQGSYILIKKADAEEVREGDVITFYSTDPKIYGVPNTHRVVGEPIVTDSGIEFVTRGDANSVNDKETAKGDRLIGIYVRRLDGLTSFVELLNGKTLIIVIVCLQICVISMSAYTYFIFKNRKSEEDTDEKKD